MRSVFTKAALAVTSLLGAMSSAQAYVQFEIANIGSGSLICDSRFACGAGFTVINSETIFFNGIVGDFSVTGTIGSSNSPGTANAATLDIASLQVTRVGSASTGQLFIGLKGFNFSDPSGEWKTLVGSAGGSSQQFGAGLDTVSSNFWADPTNAALPSNLISCSYNITANGSCNTGAPILWNDPVGSGGGLFSLRAEQLYTMSVGTSLNQTLALTAGRIPEPMTLSLVGLGLLGAAAASRRKSVK